MIDALLVPYQIGASPIFRANQNLRSHTTIIFWISHELANLINQRRRRQTDNTPPLNQGQLIDKYGLLFPATEPANAEVFVAAFPRQSCSLSLSTQQAQHHLHEDEC